MASEITSIHKSWSSLLKNLRQKITLDKLNNPLGFILLTFFSILIAIAIAKFGIMAGVFILIILIGLPLIYTIVAFPKIGITILIIAAYFVMFIIRIGVPIPLGVVMDAFQLLLLIGFLYRQKFDKNWEMMKHPISIMLLIWITYNLIEVINPTSESMMAWVYTVRSVAAVMLTFFIFMYYIDSVKFIRFILKVWIALSVFAALYAVKQEYIGFFQFEKEGLKDPKIISLYFINGSWRKFSIFSDPVAFAYNMVISSILCFVLLLEQKVIYKKIILGTFVALFLMTMLFSGTRGAYVLVPAALAMFAVINYSKKVLILSVIGGLFIGLLIIMPTGNPTLQRFQSAFKPSKDASFNLRKENQKKIQPYIQSHPMGGGLGATGVWGQKFAPNSYLANFPPDSGYVRVAVELGYIGIFLFCILIFIIIKTGINNFFKIQDPELKNYCLAMTLIIFTLNIANYPQEALVQYPINIYFNLFAALICKCLEFDKKIQQQLIT